MKTLIITAVAMSLGLLSSPTFAGGSVVGSHAMPIVDPDPAGIGTYLVSAVLLALGIAIFLYILFGEARANRGQEQDGLAAAETGAAPVLVSYHLTLVRFCAKIPSDHSWNDGCVLEPLGCGGSSATGFGQVVAIRACDALDYPDVEQPA